MEHKIDITIQARYFTHGNPKAENLILALHGYGQLAKFFLRKFQSLDPEKYYVVVPEGLHRFYLNGIDGRIGASWMTKEDRETDIQNYVSYLNCVIESLLNTQFFKNKILLGFSQGGATASRYLVKGETHFDAFILWAAIFPPDMTLQNLNKFMRSKNFLVVGDQDKYYNSQDFVNESEKLNQSGIKFDRVIFEGDHSVDIKTLQNILNEI